VTIVDLSRKRINIFRPNHCELKQPNMKKIVLVNKDLDREEDLQLTPSEIKVIEWLLEGLTNKQISEKIGLRPCSSLFHISNIQAKLNLKNRSQIIKFISENCKIVIDVDVDRESLAENPIK
jgi:DNA-binding CsgD family transcriptional regulator